MRHRPLGKPRSSNKQPTSKHKSTKNRVSSSPWKRISTWISSLTKFYTTFYWGWIFPNSMPYPWYVNSLSPRHHVDLLSDVASITQTGYRPILARDTAACILSNPNKYFSPPSSSTQWSDMSSYHHFPAPSSAPIRYHSTSTSPTYQIETFKEISYETKCPRSRWQTCPTCHIRSACSSLEITESGEKYVSAVVGVEDITTAEAWGSSISGSRIWRGEVKCQRTCAAIQLYGQWDRQREREATDGNVKGESYESSGMAITQVLGENESGNWQDKYIILMIRW